MADERDPEFRDDLSLNDENMAEDRNALPLSAGELSAEDSPKRKKSKKSKKSKRKRARSPSPNLPSTSGTRNRKSDHVISESDEDVRPFKGFKPIFSDEDSDDDDVREVQPPPQAKSRRQPPWLNSNTPPGPWQMCPPWMGPYGQYGYPNYWNQWGPEPADQDDCSIEQENPNQELAEDNSASEVPVDPEVSLAKHLQSLDAEEDTGPPIHKDLATLVENLWNKSHKDEMKELMNETKRPTNTPSLDKVSLDDDLVAGISFKSKARRTDYTLHAVHGAIVKTAISLTRLADRNFRKDPQASRQDTIDTAISSIKMLSHSTALLLQARREQFKSMLDPGLLQQISKSKSLQTANASHQLFGGELQKQAKEGQSSI